MNEILRNRRVIIYKPHLCKWCRGEIHGSKDKQIGCFCTPDCAQDYYDDASLQYYKKHKKIMLARYHANKNLKRKVALITE